MSDAAMVDWNVALNTGRRLVKAGPAISRSGAMRAVAALKEDAQRAEDYVRQVTGLQAPSGTAPVLVVDRPGWIQANIDAFREILAPLQAKAAQHAPSATSAAVGARLSGMEVGALLSYLAPKVLGQFDPFSRADPGGRLLLVAPNIVAVERELRVIPADFRLWVCLHEETHRVQFTAVPWLGDYLRSKIAAIVDETELDASAYARMLRESAGRVGEAIRQREDISLIDVVSSPGQRAVVDQITAVMSLLEGHADVVMDSVGPDVISTVVSIRAKFDIRRQGYGFDRIVRKLLGLDAKMRQYRDGAAFCREVIAKVGMEGFNAVWESPDQLPDTAEIATPARWLDRVHAQV